MIIVTPNPALDRTLIVPALKMGVVNRSTQTIIAAGGTANALSTGGAHFLLGDFERLLEETIVTKI